MVYALYAIVLVALLTAAGCMMALTSANAKIEKMAGQISAMQDELVSLAANLAQNIDELEELKSKVDEHEKKLCDLDKYMETLMEEAVDRVGKQMSDGINQVLNFTPYGV